MKVNNFTSVTENNYVNHYLTMKIEMMPRVEGIELNIRVKLASDRG